MNNISTDLTASNASIGKHKNDLINIHNEDKNIAILERETKELEDQASSLINGSLELRASGNTEEIINHIRNYFEDRFPKQTLLLEDICSSIKLFEEVTEVNSFRMLLSTIDNNMCRKFHTDINTLRMLCTYVGPGTLWLTDDNINEKHCQSQNTNESIVKDESLIQQVNTGDIVILKGALYPNSKAILHRSPSIEESGLKRLMLRIDTNEHLNYFK